MRQTYILQTVALGTTIHLQQKAKTTGQRAPSIPIEQSVPVFFFFLVWIVMFQQSFIVLCPIYVDYFLLRRFSLT